jgi:hypothetical protein
VLTDKGKREAMGAAGGATARRFDWNRLVKQVEAVYERCARQPVSPAERSLSGRSARTRRAR